MKMRAINAAVLLSAALAASNNPGRPGPVTRSQTRQMQAQQAQQAAAQQPPQQAPNPPAQPQRPPENPTVTPADLATFNNCPLTDDGLVQYLMASPEIVNAYLDALNISLEMQKMPDSCHVSKLVGKSRSGWDMSLFSTFLELYLHKMRANSTKPNIRQELIYFYKLLFNTNTPQAENVLKYIFGIVFTRDWSIEQDNAGDTLTIEAPETAQGGVVMAQGYFGTADQRIASSLITYHYLSMLLRSRTVRNVICGNFSLRFATREFRFHFEHLYDIFAESQLDGVVNNAYGNIMRVIALVDQSGGATAGATTTTAAATTTMAATTAPTTTMAATTDTPSAFPTTFDAAVREITFEMFTMVAGMRQLLNGVPLGPNETADTALIKRLSSMKDRRGGLIMSDRALKLLEDAKKYVKDIRKQLGGEAAAHPTFILMNSVLALIKINHCICAMLTLLFEPEMYPMAVTALQDVLQQMICCELEVPKAMKLTAVLRALPQAEAIFLASLDRELTDDLMDDDLDG